MCLGLKKFSLLILLCSAVIFGAVFGNVQTSSAAVYLSGRILLQVQDKGQAWYVNPINGQRYFLGRPDDAFNIMRSLGLGVSNSDLNSFLIKAPARLAGRIILKVQDKGQAYYIDPVQLKLYYLGRPDDAFQVMRSRGLGITNSDLARIPIASGQGTLINALLTPVANTELKTFTFKYQNTNFELIQALSPDLYNLYKNSPKVVTYNSNQEPPNLREVFYGLFLKAKTNDTSLDEIITKLKAVAVQNNWSDDQMLEFTLSFIQYIPYDHDKVSANASINSNPYFPYETLYNDKGVCSDKTFLGVALLRKLGYGAAILDFPQINHTALGIACPTEYSINNSGYCYGETTNYFPLGVIPQTINNGQAQTANEFTNLFNPANLGTIEIYQATTGKIYQGMPALSARIATLKTQKDQIDSSSAEVKSLSDDLNAKQALVVYQKNQLDAYYNSGQIGQYNQMINGYNDLVNQYNAALTVYKIKVDAYNALVNSFNLAVKTFYQQS